MFSDMMKRAIEQVSGEVVHEIEAEDSDCPFEEIVAETVLDAGRLGMFGHPEAQAELELLLEKHSWNDVVMEAKRYVYT